VVDDGSIDNTVGAAERAGKCTVRVLRNPGNRGKGYSVRHGMTEAKAMAVIHGCRSSTPIEELETLWAAAEKSGAQVVIGSRALDRSLIGVHQSVFRETAGKLSTWRFA